MDALNLNHSSENTGFWVWADPFSQGAGHAGGALKTSADCPPGVADSIELHNGMQVTRRATIKALGKYTMQMPEYDHQCKKRCSNGRVASDGDRSAATVSDEVG